MILRPIALLSAAVLVLGLPARAEEEVVIRANRLPAYQGDEVFAQLDLKRDDLGRASIDQSLKREAQASLFRRNSSLTANPTVQGISLRAIGPSGAGRALVTLDGVPQNDPFGGWVIWAALPNDAISHVHVLKGAGGGAYGAGALTGVIDLSLQPAGAGNYGRVTVGEDGNLNAALGVGAGPVALSYSDNTLHGDTPVRYPQAGAADVPAYGRDQAWLAHADVAQCGGNCVVSVLAGSYDSRRDTGLKGAAATSTGDQLAVSLTRQPGVDHKGWRLQAWHRDSDLSNTSVSVAAGRTDTTLANNQVRTPARGDGVNAALRHQEGATEWEVGFDGRTASGESREFFRYISGAATRFRVSGGKTSLAGLYAEGSRVAGPWTLSGAVRADEWRAFAGHRTETDTSTGAAALTLNPADQKVAMVSARAGLGYSLTGNMLLRFAVYNGFRPPSLNELYRPFRVGNDVTEANAALKPETLSGAEIGIRRGNAETFIDAGLFANSLRDPITNVTVALGPFTSPTAGVIPAGGSLRMRENMGEIRAQGVETRARWAVGEQVALTASATLTHARVEQATAALNGKRPAEAPDYSASAGIQARLMKATVHADLSFEGETFDDDLNTLPLKASRRLSIDVNYPLAPHLAVNLAIDNALDDRIPITHAGDGTIGYDNRRMVSVGLVYRR
ncbi:MAG TPA: TonB-dependent receptor [Asticcacaulis sp.]|nr:TonB-dependent receptor [Asticcacaulis sp.]